MTRKIIKNLLFTFIILGIIIFVLVVVTELGFRIFWQHSDSFYQSDKYISQIHVPGMRGRSIGKEFNVEMYINSHGYVGKEYDYEKSPEVWRAIMLGDSMVEAMQVTPEDNFTSLVEQKLNDQSEGNYEVINMGVSNFGTVRSYLNLVNYGLKYNPDLVFYALAVTNDMSDNYMEQEEDATRNKSQSTSLKQRFKAFLINHSEFALYVRNKTNTSVPLRKFFTKLGVISEYKNIIHEEDPTKELPIKYHIYAQEDTDLFTLEWDKTKEYINKIKTTLETKGIDFVIVLIPARDQIYEDSWEKVKESFEALNMYDLDLAKPQRVLKDYFDKEEIKYLDLYPVLKQASIDDEERLYFIIDGHFAPRGHQVTGQAIYGFLQNNFFSTTSRESIIN